MKHLKLYENFDRQTVNDLLRRSIHAMQRGESSTKVQWLLDALHAATIRSGGEEERDMIFGTLIDLASDDKTYEPWLDLINAYTGKTDWEDVSNDRDAQRMSQPELDKAINSAIDRGDWDQVTKLSQYLKEDRSPYK